MAEGKHLCLSRYTLLLKLHILTDDGLFQLYEMYKTSSGIFLQPVQKLLQVP